MLYIVTLLRGFLFGPRKSTHPDGSMFFLVDQMPWPWRRIAWKRIEQAERDG